MKPLLLVFLAVCISACASNSPASDRSEDPVAIAKRTECETLVLSLAAELAELQSCKSDDECGSNVPAVGSCGCTHNPVTRKNADATRYLKILESMQQRQCAEAGMMGTCDCPPVEGFRCVNHRCDWKRVDGTQRAR